MQQRLNVLNLAPHPFGKPGLLHDTTQHRSAATALPAPHVNGAMEGTNQAFDIGRCHGERVTPEIPSSNWRVVLAFRGVSSVRPRRDRKMNGSIHSSTVEQVEQIVTGFGIDIGPRANVEPTWGLAPPPCPWSAFGGRSRPG